jgi:hypothetical protein
MRNSAMQNGLILGAIFSVNFLLSVTQNPFLSLLSNILAIGLLFILYKMAVRFRETECEQVISYWKAFLYIILMFFYASLISAIFKFVYLKFININYLDQIFNQMMKVFEEFKIKIGDSDIKEAEAMFRPLNFAIISIWSNMIIGTITGLIMSIFIRKEKNIFQQQ